MLSWPSGSEEEDDEDVKSLWQQCWQWQTADKSWSEKLAQTLGLGVLKNKAIIYSKAETIWGGGGVRFC